MYWTYLFLFVCMIFTPEVVAGELLFFGEEDLESIIIFGLGLVGLLLYLGKESALMRAIRDKLSLQEESNKIRKDLAQSYGYIGEVNRQLEILKHMIAASPHTIEELRETDQTGAYRPVFEAALLLAQSDAAALYFVDTESRQLVATYASDPEGQAFQKLSAETLLDAKKYWWQDDGLSFVRSSEEARGVTAFLVFRSVKNEIDEIGVFQILVTQALLLFSLRRAHIPGRLPL